jgi:hypothetical protein
MLVNERAVEWRALLTFAHGMIFTVANGCKGDLRFSTLKLVTLLGHVLPGGSASE